MMLQIKHWLTSPTFPGDEEKTIRARLLHITLLSVMGFMFIVMAGNWLGGRTPAPVFGIDAAVVAVCLLFYYGMRRGKVGLVSIGLMALGITSIVLAVASLGTIRTPTTAAFVTLVIVAGLLFDLGGVIAMTILSSLAILGLIVAENAGLLPAPDLSVTITQWITYTALFGSSSGLTIMVLRSTRQALGRAQSEIAKRARIETQLRESEERFRRLYEQAPLGYQSLDAEGCLIDVNQAWLDLLGYSRDEVIGRWFGDFLAPHQVDAFKQRFPHFKATGEVHVDLEMVQRVGSTVVVHIDGRIGHDEHGQFKQTHCILHDITERKRAEEEIRHRVEELAALNRGARQLAEGLDMARVAAYIARACVQTFGACLAWLLRAEPDGSMGYITHFPACVQYPAQVAIRWDDSPLGRGPTGRAVRSGWPVVFADLATAPDYTLWWEAALKQGFVTSAALPLVSGDKAFGCLSLYSDRPGFFTPERVEFFQTFAGQAAAALENARLFEAAQKELAQRKQVEEVLRHHELQLSLIYDNASDVLFYLAVEPDDHFRFVSVNQVFLQATGLAEDQIIGKDIRKVIPEPAHELVLSKYHEVIRERRTATWEEISIYPAGKKYGEVSVTPIFDAAGHCTHLVGAVHDVTENRIAQERIRASESRYRAFFENSMDAILLTSPDGSVQVANPAACQMFGRTEAEIVRAGRAGVVDTSDPRLSALLAERARTGKAHGELTLLRRDGTPFPAELSSSVFQDGDGSLRTCMIIRDITERKKATEALRESREQLRALADYLHTAQEKERAYIAREVHDEFGQSLTALKIDLAWLARRLPKDEAALANKVEDMTALVDDTIQRVRRIATELRPDLLDDLGLSAAVEWQAQEFARRTGIICQVDLDEETLADPLAALDRDLCTAIFRIFQEALTNVARHAGATRVRVTLRQVKDVLILTVHDNGKGLPAEAVYSPRSLGLLGMRERALSWEGSVTFEGVPGRGTTVTLRVPYLASQRLTH